VSSTGSFGRRYPRTRTTGDRQQSRCAAGPRWWGVSLRHPDELRRGIEDNLRTLGVDRLAAVNLRLMDDSRSCCGAAAGRRELSVLVGSLLSRS
jgi:hypothetical protein